MVGKDPAADIRAGGFGSRALKNALGGCGRGAGRALDPQPRGRGCRARACRGVGLVLGPGVGVSVPLLAGSPTGCPLRVYALLLRGYFMAS